MDLQRRDFLKAAALSVSAMTAKRMTGRAQAAPATNTSPEATNVEPSSSAEVRVAILRCDTHAFWYAHFFDRPDPVRMRRHHRGIHYYFYKPDNPLEQRIGPEPGMRITRLFDERDRRNAEAVADALGGRPRVCDTCEEASDDVDLVYVANCNFNGEDHLALAAPGLRKGVPHFFDMPFAFTLRDARAIVSLARENNTAVMCGFMLRESPHFHRFRMRLDDIGPVRRLVVPTFGATLENLSCGTTITQAILGDGCEWVESLGPTPFDCLRMHYAGPQGGTEAILANASRPAPGRTMTSANYHHCGYTVSAYGPGGAIHSPRVDDYLFMEGGARLAAMARQMALTRRPPVAYSSMLELIEMAEAARLSHKTGRRVTLAEVRG